MASITISKIQTEITSLSEGDFIIVSKKNGSTYTSAKMTSDNLKTNIKSSITSDDLPIADTSSRGTIKVGSGLTINEDGTLNAIEITVDDKLSDTSTNPVQNKIITAAIGDINSVLDAINGEII